MEVESHWKGNELMTNCKTGFSLLEPHVCSLEEPQANSATAGEATLKAIPNSVIGSQSASSSSTSRHAKDGLDGRVAIGNGPAVPSDIPIHEQVLQRQRQALAAPAENANAKRKTTALTTGEGHAVKKQRRLSTDMEVDAVVGGTSWSVHV
jgi:transducin (beta)-like 1